MSKTLLKEDRSWAQGMTQDEFNIEYPRRVLGADVIPDVISYRDNIHGQGVYGDTNVNPEDIRPERDGLHGDEPEKQIMNAPGMLTCNYCGRDNLKSKFGLMAHMRHCKSKKG